MIIFNSILFFIISTYILYRLFPDLPKSLDKIPPYDYKFLDNLFITRPQFEQVPEVDYALAPQHDSSQELVWCGDQCMTAEQYNIQYQNLKRLLGLRQNKGKSIIWNHGRLELG
jgi:hypothetical protein